MKNSLKKIVVVQGDYFITSEHAPILLASRRNQTRTLPFPPWLKRLSCCLRKRRFFSFPKHVSFSVIDDKNILLLLRSLWFSFSNRFGSMP